MTRMKNRFGDRFAILCGVDTLTCVFPLETVAINNLVNASRIKEELEIYRWFLPLLELDINPKLVQNIKLSEVYTGIGTENVRAPRLPLFGEKRKNVIKTIEDSLKSRPVLPDYKNL